MVGHCLHVWHIFSYVMPYFENWLLGSVLTSFQNTSVFFHLRVFVLLLSGLSFLFMSERIGLRKLFAKLSYCMTLCSFLRGQVVNCSQRS
jgi:hypothetical protein